ncbi:Piso0_000780 [Millerozyma farinosa CBS 7064]|uniref:Ribonuclease n=1 Tax=Pichia sorbitophila (strain ATCC MYA-4447 / BCRC 22081 / CBS 7064 / NBRC 10061 / NRRL Y-12695) TaxID=559304 RepID=G8YQ16_PICSO|nr:Piso0_000780 [Millerozyma farinosa CBS 7064]
MFSCFVSINFSIHTNMTISLDEKRAVESEDRGSIKRAKTENIQINEDQEIQAWMPQSVRSMVDALKFDSHTCHSEIPSAIASQPDEPLVLGVDEAGRGPVLTPSFNVLESENPNFFNSAWYFGFSDSKTLKEGVRTDLLQKIEDEEHELHNNVGWATTQISAKDISSGMLRSSLGKGAYNLNDQAHDTTIELIQQIIDKKLNIAKIFVDTVGPPASYQAKLQRRFPGVEVTVTKKADSLFPVVSTASIVAKVTRDKVLHHYCSIAPLLQSAAFGSGYPSDPNTSRWLNSSVDTVFGWFFGLVRFSWQTAKDALVKNGACSVIYEAECVKEDSGYRNVASFFDNPSSPKDSSLSVDCSFYSSSEVTL